MRSNTNFHPQTKMLISICWICFLVFNVLNMTRTDGWIQNLSKKERWYMVILLNWLNIVHDTVELVHPCLDCTLMDYTLMDYSWLDYRHLDYLWHLDYRRLDYFRLQGRSDYKDIWTIAIWTITVWTILDYRDVWTTRTFGLPPFGLLRQTD